MMSPITLSIDDVELRQSLALILRQVDLDLLGDERAW